MTPAALERDHCGQLLDQLAADLIGHRDAAATRGIPDRSQEFSAGAAAGLNTAIGEIAAIHRVLTGEPAEAVAGSLRRQRAMAVLGVAIRAVWAATRLLDGDPDRDLAAAARQLGRAAIQLRGQLGGQVGGQISGAGGGRR